MHFMQLAAIFRLSDFIPQSQTDPILCSRMEAAAILCRVGTEQFCSLIG